MLDTGLGIGFEDRVHLRGAVESALPPMQLVLPLMAAAHALGSVSVGGENHPSVSGCFG